MNRPALRTLVPVAALAAAPVLAGPGEGITTGRLTLRPYVDASYTYDSNARRIPDRPAPDGDDDGAADTGPAERTYTEESDTYYELRGGTSLAWVGDETVVSGSLFGYLRRYSDLDEEDEEGFGESLGLARGTRDTLAWRAYQSYEQRFDYALGQPATDPAAAGAGPALSPVTDPSLELEDDFLRSRARRDVFGAGVNAGRDLSDRHALDAGYSYSQTEYDEDLLNGQSRHNGTASLGRRITYKTSTFVSGAYGLEDNDNYQDAVPYYSVLAGLRSSASPKLAYSVGIGYQSYETAELRPRELEDGTRVYPDGSRELPDGTVLPPEPRRNPVTGAIIEDPDIASRQTGLAYDASLRWSPSDKVGVSLAARNSYDSSSAGSQRQVNALNLTASYRPRNAVTFSVYAGYRDEENVTETVQVEEDGTETRLKPTREVLSAGARVGYQPAGKWYQLYASLNYEDYGSNQDLGDYDRLRVGAGLRATY